MKYDIYNSFQRRTYRETYNNRYNEGVEHERDAAWDDAYATFPNADYIEEF